MPPLNGLLYRRLERRFGHVKITSQGEAMIARATKDVTGDPVLSITHAGEYYKICCPYCNDTRYRLYVNHMFGKTDGHKRRILYLAVCYNESCLAEPENKRDFIDKLDDIHLAEAEVRPGKIVSAEAREVTLPGDCISLAKLSKRHPAVVYLGTDRGYDVAYLTEKYGLLYCTNSRYSLAEDRIIIPVYEKGKLKGWQARYVGELDWKGPRRKELPPKYFSCPGSDFRSRCIYGYETMREWETGVLVEGPTDRWNFGMMAGCIFGNTVTDFQKKKFHTAFRDRTGVLLLDPEEMESKATIRLLDHFRVAMKRRFCAVKLPDGTDPGQLDRAFLREYVRDEAGRQGVTVRYKRVTN